MGVGVVQGVLVSLGAPRLADRKVRVADGGFDQRRLMAGGGGKEDLAACPSVPGWCRRRCRPPGRWSAPGPGCHSQSPGPGRRPAGPGCGFGHRDPPPAPAEAGRSGRCLRWGGFGVPLVLAAGGQGEEKGVAARRAAGIFLIVSSASSFGEFWEGRGKLALRSGR